MSVITVPTPVLCPFQFLFQSFSNFFGTDLELTRSSYCYYRSSYRSCPFQLLFLVSSSFRSYQFPFYFVCSLVWIGTDGANLVYLCQDKKLVYIQGMTTRAYEIEYMSTEMHVHNPTRVHMQCTHMFRLVAYTLEALTQKGICYSCASQ